MSRTRFARKAVIAVAKYVSRKHSSQDKDNACQLNRLTVKSRRNQYAGREDSLVERIAKHVSSSRRVRAGYGPIRTGDGGKAASNGARVVVALHLDDKIRPIVACSLKTPRVAIRCHVCAGDSIPHCRQAAASRPKRVAVWMGWLVAVRAREFCVSKIPRAKIEANIAAAVRVRREISKVWVRNGGAVIR